jgi:methylated-DNA-[protein]-cysteine S-methyltransferase
MDQLVFRLERMSTACGGILFATDDDGNLRALDWEDHQTRMHRLLRLHYGAGTVRLESQRSASEVRRSLQAYLAGDLHAIDAVTVKTCGTPFQRAVWGALRTIPAGSTLSYGALATMLGRSTAVRAVGRANGANPVSIVVPCHRLIGTDASLTGYGGGLERKRWLLEHEGVLLKRYPQSGTHWHAFQTGSDSGER